MKLVQAEVVEVSLEPEEELEAALVRLGHAEVRRTWAEEAAERATPETIAEAEARLAEAELEVGVARVVIYQLVADAREAGEAAGRCSLSRLQDYLGLDEDELPED